ncbi:MAG: DUF2934 domain-containing protein [Bauldia sp.]|nr:DUF2934 domain-containing protein [Bauldia sp.]
MPRKNTTARGLGPAQPLQETIDEGSATAMPDTAPGVDDETIRTIAYGFWLADGKPAGREAEHWARAKEEAARLNRDQRPEFSTRPTTGIEAEDRATAEQGGRPAGAAKAVKSAKPPGKATQTYGQPE